VIPFLVALIIGGAFVIGQFLQLVGGFAIHDVPPWVRRAHLGVLAALVGQPMLVPVVASSGNHLATLVAAFLPLVAVVALYAYVVIRHEGFTTIATAGVGTGETWRRTRGAINKLFHGLGLYFFVNLIYGLWFAALPFGEDRTVIPWAFATWMLVLLGLAVLGEPARKIGRILLMAVFSAALFALIVGIPYVLANGGWEKTKHDLAEARKAKAAPATALSVPTAATKDCAAASCTARIALPVDGSKSAAVNIDDVVPDTWNYSFSGPPGTVVHWKNFGDSAPIDIGFDLGDGHRGWGSRDGPVTFSAPAGTGGKVTIQSHPPR